MIKWWENLTEQRKRLYTAIGVGSLPLLVVCGIAVPAFLFGPAGVLLGLAVSLGCILGIVTYHINT